MLEIIDVNGYSIARDKVQEITKVTDGEEVEGLYGKRFKNEIINNNKISKRVV